MKRSLLLLLAAILLTGCSLPWLSRPRAEIDWVDFFKWNGIMYTADFGGQGRPLQEADLGEEFARVRFKVAENVHDPAYKTRDGDAAFLEPGTPVYKVKGYDPRFRLAARRGGRIFLYEADNNPAARTGASAPAPGAAPQRLRRSGTASPSS